MTIIYAGRAIQCQYGEDGIGELKFDLNGESVNKFNALTLKELKEVTEKLWQESATKKLKGLLLTSAKDSFVVGADVTEFLGYFKRPEEELLSWIREVNQTFNKIEDLPYPTVALINGYAFGGGFEIALTCTYRLAALTAKVGLPETQLGIFPGWGGTVRLSRLTGADNAIEWIASGKQYSAMEALKNHAVDAVMNPEELRPAAVALLNEIWEGKREWKERRVEKTSPLKLDATESMMVFEGSKAFIAGMAGPHYPAPVLAVETMQKGASLERNEALLIESENFVKLAKSPVAASLVRIFLGDQFLKKENKKYSKLAKPIERAAVLGAGIMGGGIAYQCSSSKIPVVMKDIANPAIDLGLGEASKLLKKKVEQGRMKLDEMTDVLNRIHGTLSYDEVSGADMIVEAVVENLEIKQKVLAETESRVKKGTVLASNTSTISITKLAEGLKSPENFCGMHFFNPVHKMPLVEVIRGKLSSEETIATTVAFAETLGKKPIVVNDCPGFLVNRVLFPYFNGFIQLINDGVDFQKIDKVMEKFGWPMGPAYLLDVVGMDTCYHAINIMARGYPDRMDFKGPNILENMFRNKRFGQKNQKGFYEYQTDRQGKVVKVVNQEVYELIKPLSQGKSWSLGDQEIVERMMLPMLFESARCLEEKIVQTPTEVDMGVVYGLGFPPFRGGIMSYADSLGSQALVELSKKYEALGPLYAAPKNVLEMAKKGAGFYLF